MKITVPALAALVLFTVAGCNKSPDGGKTLARIDGDAITEKEYEMYLQLRHARQIPSGDKAKEKEVVLNEMVDRILLTRHARALKLDADPETYFLLKRVEENVLAQALFRKIVNDKPIGDDDIKQRMTSDLEQMHKNEYKVSHILVATEDEAKELLAQLKKGTAFEALARQKSIDKDSARNGGRLGDWLRQNHVVPEFFTAVAATKKGTTAEAPVKSEFGWHIVRVIDARAIPNFPTVAQFMENKDAREKTANRIREDRVQTLVKELRDKAKVKIE